MKGFHVLVVRPVLRWIAGVRYRGLNRIPDGPCIVVSNHNSHLDAAILMTLFPLRRLTRVHPVAAADYFGKTPFRRTVAEVLMNAVPIERKASGGVDPLEPVSDWLRKGDSLIFFPEGSRGKAGVIAPFRPGIGRLVKQVPGMLVLPVFLAGPERIWPRGQPVPVPLNIEAVIGRPRSYPSDLDAREIAERLRRDVIALAPPPPPEPAASERPIRIAVCGLDPVVRNTFMRNLAEKLGPHAATLAVDEHLIEADADGLREMPRPIPQPTRPGLVRFMKVLLGAWGRTRGKQFVEMVERAQLSEAFDQGRASRFVVTDGSALVDLLARAMAHIYRDVFDEAQIRRLIEYMAGGEKIPFRQWGGFIRKAPEIWVLAEFDLARPAVPDVVVNVGLPVERVMENLRSRGVELGKNDNEADLERMREAYARVGALLKKRGRVDVVDLDLDAVDTDEALQRVADVCLGHIEAEARAAPRG